MASPAEGLAATISRRLMTGPPQCASVRTPTATTPPVEGPSV
jgi:hypothetical protein